MPQSADLVGYQDCFQQWCALCLQGVEYAKYVGPNGLFHFLPCGHVAPFYVSTAREGTGA